MSHLIPVQLSMISVLFSYLVHPIKGYIQPLMGPDSFWYWQKAKSVVLSLGSVVYYIRGTADIDPNDDKIDKTAAERNQPCPV